MDEVVGHPGTFLCILLVYCFSRREVFDFCRSDSFYSE